MVDANTDLQEIIYHYREAAQRTSDSDTSIVNKWAPKLHDYYKQLRVSEEGKTLILTLLSDPSPHVRCWAAAHSLFLGEIQARQTLEELRDAKGSSAFDAEMTLREFDKGTLSFDY